MQGYAPTDDDVARARRNTYQDSPEIDAEQRAILDAKMDAELEADAAQYAEALSGDDPDLLLSNLSRAQLVAMCKDSLELVAQMRQDGAVLPSESGELAEEGDDPEWEVRQKRARDERKWALNDFLEGFRPTDHQRLAQSVLEEVRRIRKHCFIEQTADAFWGGLERCWLLDYVLDSPECVSGSNAQRGMLRIAQARVDHLRDEIKRCLEETEL